MTIALVALMALFPGDVPAAAAPVLPVTYYQAVEPVAPAPLIPRPDLPAGPPPDQCDTPAVWARAESLAWWVQGAKLPVLATESPAGTRQANAGVPGTLGTHAVLGDQLVNGDARWGGRFEGGLWLGPDYCDVGLQLGAFYLADAQENRAVGDPTGTRILARPYVNARTRLPTAELISFPSVRSGVVSVSVSNSDVAGADALVRLPILCAPCPDGSFRLDYLLGYRYLYLADRLTVREEVLQLAAPNAGTASTLLDVFHATNRFHGGSLGAAGVYRRGAFSAELTSRLDIGEMHRDVLISGSTATMTPGVGTRVTPGGLLAQPTNGGTHGPDGVALIPEVDLRLGWQFASWLRLTAGYSLLVISDVARPGEQIDFQVNPNLLPGATARGGVVRPVYPSGRTDGWIQGLSLGVELFY